MEVKMDLLKVFRLILKELWIILVVTIICAILSGVISTYVIKKTYQSTATVMVLQNNLNGQNTTIQSGDIMVAQQFVNSFMEIISFPRVLDLVSKQLNRKYSTDAIKKMVTITNTTNTLILTINVKCHNAQDASDIANAVVSNFINEVRTILNFDIIKQIDTAKAPSSPVSPNIPLNIALAGFVGLLLSVGIIILIAYFDNTIKTEDDITKYLELPVIGLIPLYVEEQKKWII
jgi:capsular polysaccharide biosynthesis protein